MEDTGDKRMLIIRCNDTVNNVTVYNGTGEMMFSQTLHGNAGEDQQLTLPKLPPGSYPITMDTKKGMRSASFTILD